MNDLICVFFKNGYTQSVIDCVILFISTIIETIELADKNDILSVYIIDDINNTIYKNEEIKKLCTEFKQQIIFNTINEINKNKIKNNCKAKEPNFLNENNYIKPICKEER